MGGFYAKEQAYDDNFYQELLQPAKSAKRIGGRVPNKDRRWKGLRNPNGIKCVYYASNISTTGMAGLSVRGHIVKDVISLSDRSCDWRGDCGVLLVFK